jgi:hypothetical protein
MNEKQSQALKRATEIVDIQFRDGDIFDWFIEIQDEYRTQLSKN